MTPIQAAHTAVLIILAIALYLTYLHERKKWMTGRQNRRHARRVELESQAHAAVAHEEFLALRNPAHFERLLEACPAQSPQAEDAFDHQAKMVRHLAERDEELSATPQPWTGVSLQHHMAKLNIYDIDDEAAPQESFARYRRAGEST